MDQLTSQHCDRVHGEKDEACHNTVEGEPNLAGYRVHWCHR